MDYKMGPGIWEQINEDLVEMTFTSEDMENTIKECLNQPVENNTYKLYTGEEGYKTYSDAVTRLLETQMIHRITGTIYKEEEYASGVGLTNLEIVEEYMEELEKE